MPRSLRFSLLAASLALAAVYVVRPGEALWIAGLTLAGGACVLAALRCRPGRRRPWYLLATAMAAGIASTAIGGVSALSAGGPRAAAINLLFVASYASMGAGALSFSRARRATAATVARPSMPVWWRSR